MSGKIKFLDNELINKIAAGEIIERPASIVKELIENSIDAGSTQIKIFIEHGGMRSISILDNGCGIGRDDAVMAFERHATSKIAKTDDLFDIKTLGFRGEALASIASVSQIEMETKEEKDLIGTKINISFGIPKEVTDSGCHIGTKIIITHLFNNVPVRKKFLKTVNTELSYIINIVTQYMLAFPDIAFILAHNNRILYNFPKTKSIEERIYEIYGLDIKNNLIKLNYKIDNIELYIHGFISNPSYSKPNKNYQIIFVNKRAVKNKTISHAIYEGYRSFLMVDRHPMTIINIDIDSKFVDVNIHPAKKEVKFTDDGIIHNSVCNAISEALKSGCGNNFFIDEKHSENININEMPQTYYTNTNTIKSENDIKFEYSLLKDGIKNESMNMPSLKPLVQIKNTYWIVENNNNNKYYILDQHAFHERILFEKILLSIKNKHFETQRLLFPINIEFTIEETNFFKDHINELIHFGFEIEHFGASSFVIKEVPVFLLKADIKEFLLNIYNDFNVNNMKYDFIIKIAIIMACHGAIKAGDKIDLQEIRCILLEAEKLNIPHFCPHGRPAVVEITTEELEKKFKR